MLYNKNNVRKTNDKKILHKVGKQWKVVSVALLMAIGGGAVATHAANAQSNQGANAATVNEASVIANYKPTAVSAASAAPKSASATSKSASVAPKSVNYSYASTSSGYAASYRAKTLNDKVAAQSAGNVVNRYVKSLNAKFPAVTGFLNNNVASASANAKSDASLANSYSAVAANSANSSAVSELASKAGLTTSDFIGSVQNTESGYAANVKSASKDAKALNVASDLATKFLAANWTEISAEAQANSAIASANYRVVFAKAGYQNVENAQNAVNKNNDDLTNAQVASIEATGADEAAVEESANDASAVNSFAKSMTQSQANNSSAFWNSSAVSSEVQAYAKSAGVDNSYKANVPSSSDYNFSNVNSASVPTSALNAVIADTAVMSAAGSVKASANSTIASANAAKASLATNLSNAKSAFNAASAELSSASASTEVASLANKDANSISAGMSANNSSEVESLVEGVANRTPQVGIQTLLNYASSNKARGVYAANDAAELASALGVNVFDVYNNRAGLQDIAKDFRVAAGNTLTSKASNVASTVATNFTNATSASAKYSASNDEGVTLASYFASSYSADASSEASAESNAANSANDFYLGFANSAEFTSADTAMRAAKSAEPNDAELAEAWGQQVLNWAPQFVTTEKSFGLYNVKNNKFTRLATVPAGVRLEVTGVQIMDNGFVRYQTSYNGKKGTVNSYPSYVKDTYLKAADSANVVVTGDTPVYNSVHLMHSTKTKAVAKAGKEYYGVRVVANIYGGVSRVQLGDNQFISGNTAVVSLDNGASNNNQPDNSTNANNSKVSFWK